MTCTTGHRGRKPAGQCPAAASTRGSVASMRLQAAWSCLRAGRPFTRALMTVQGFPRKLYAGKSSLDHGTERTEVNKADIQTTNSTDVTVPQLGPGNVDHLG